MSRHLLTSLFLLILNSYQCYGQDSTQLLLAKIPNSYFDKSAKTTLILTTINSRVLISARFIFNSINQGNDYGARLEDGLRLLMIKGAIEDRIWPYISGEYSKPVPNFSKQSINYYKIRSYTKIESITIDTILRLLKEKRPILISLPVSSAFGRASNGLYDFPLRSEDILGYTVFCLVGYDHSKKLVKFKNSWGVHWGDKGYGYMQYQDIQKAVRAAYFIQL